MMVLPLGFCCCYIKTAQMCNVGGEKRLWREFLYTTFSLLDFLIFVVVCFLFFFNIFCRFSSVVAWHCPGPITWQTAYIKTVELQWGSLRIALEDAGSLQSRNQQVRLALTLARSLTLPVLLQFLLCRNGTKKTHIISGPCSKNSNSRSIFCVCVLLSRNNLNSCCWRL